MNKTGDGQIHAMRHSLAHIMASAVAKLWPKARFGVGPVVENGFYYDIDVPGVAISEEDFPKIEAEMRKIISEKQSFVHSVKPIDEALGWAKASRQPYKEELLNDLMRAGTTLASDLNSDELGTITSGEAKASEASFYTNGDFTDLCRGPHAKTTGDVGEFKLMRVAGAYWRGKDTNPQMQRLYGVAFETKKELAEHLLMLEEAKKRDHRTLGRDLDLFTFSELVGQGLPLWTPRGTTLRTELDRFVQEMRDEVGFMAVTVPHITKKDLYEKSGHWSKFSDELFKIKTREGHEFAMKPMNCPHHTQIYDSKQRSYRDLPIRYRETTMVYRDEQTGELGGLSRVRAITQDDAHVFCRYSQVETEVLTLWGIVEKFYSGVGMPLRMRLSLHDPAKRADYMGTDKQWKDVEATLRKIVQDKIGNDFEEAPGDAAFYGPKLDFMGKDALGREHQVATIQFDFNQPEGFDLTCIDENGAQERIAMVHCAVMGSIERFLAIYIEHTGGRFPVWAAPEQIRIVTPNQDEKVVELAQKIAEEAREKYGLRVELDTSNESVGKKIRESEMQKVPYLVVVGAKELESGLVMPRVRADMRVKEGNVEPIKVDNFLHTVANEAKSRVSKSSI
ncbi:MAG: threonine--tRNA ligase [Patescibacteria group bacterium]